MIHIFYDIFEYLKYVVHRFRNHCFIYFQNLLIAAVPFQDQSQTNESQFLAETYEDLLSTAIINKVG